MRRIHSIPRFIPCGLSKAHAGTTAVLVDELNAGRYFSSWRCSALMQRTVPVTERITAVSIAMTSLRNLTRRHDLRHSPFRHPVSTTGRLIWVCFAISACDA